MINNSIKIALLIAGLVVVSNGSAEEVIEDSLKDVEQVVVPKIYRRDVKAPKIDARDIEFTLYGGVLSMEDFNASPVGGARLAYHVTEDFFLEAGFAVATINDDAFRRFGLNLFPSEDESFSYYDLAVGYNVLPGEFFWGENHAIPTYLYVIAGVGSFTLVDEDFFSVNFGAGVRLLLTDRFTLHVDVRDRIFENTLLGDEELSNNLEMTLSLGLLF